MKSNIKNTLYTGLAVASSVMAMVSCSDTWDEHYDANASGAGNETLMQQIEKKAPDFAKVIKAVKYDRELNSDNSFTVWAPQHCNVDSLLDLAKTDSADVVDGFIKNHIARYTISMDGSEKKIALINNKYSVFNSKYFSTSNLVEANIACKNGVLHVVDNSNPYLMSIFERIKEQYKTSDYAFKDSVGGSLYTFLRKYDADSLDVNKSISRGYDENGNQVWVDSVIIRNNTALKNIDALVYEEDSNYIAIIPSPEAYHRRYQQYRKLFVFNNKLNENEDTDVAKDLSIHYANMFAMNDLFYSMTNNEHFEDSLKSTTYSYGTIGVYYRKNNKNQLKPTHDILAGLNSETCSNGKAYFVDEYPISIFEQAFYEITLPFYPTYLAKASSSTNKEFTTNINKEVYTKAALTEFTYTEQDSTYTDEETGETKTVKVFDKKKYANEKRGYYFYYPKIAKKTTQYTFFIPDYLSGTYDVSVVTVPMWVLYALELDMPWTPSGDVPSFEVSIFERNNKGQYGSSTSLINEKFKDSASEKYRFYPSIENVMDTTYLGEYTFQNTYYGRGTSEDACGAMIQFKTKAKEQDFLFSCLILTPKAIKED